MTIIPSKAKDVPGAKQELQQSLGEQNTTVLLFRSSPTNEAAVGNIVAMADQLAQRDNLAEWRVVWIKDANLLPDEVKSYFGANDDKVAASLKYGTGTPRTVGSLFAPADLGDRIAIGQAFSNAGPEDA